ncbi:MAG: hypothetical protein ACLR8P_14825 [Clostridium fessum]
MKLFQRDEAYGMMVRDLKTAQSVSYAVPAVLEKTRAGISEDRIYVDADVGAVSFRRDPSEMIWDWENAAGDCASTAFYQEKPSRKRLEMKAVGQNYLFRL